MESFENYFLQIYEKHKKFVYTLIRFYKKDSRSSDDIFREAWLEIYRGLEKFRGDSKISAWIYSVVRNRTLNFLKRENRTANAENEAGREKGPARGGFNERRPDERNFYEDRQYDVRRCALTFNAFPTAVFLTLRRRGVSF
jgi:RNA polymerase sigma factor (sigma-70 family)